MKKMLTLDEVCQLTNRKRRALQSMIHRGKFPCSKVAGRICFDPDELDRFLKLSRKTTAEQAAKKQRGAV